MFGGGTSTSVLMSRSAVGGLIGISLPPTVAHADTVLFLHSTEKTS